MARSALLVGGLVPTHWVLDFIAHRPDMPIYPGGPKYGLGMWNSVPLTISVEYVLFAAGIALYLSATRREGYHGKIGLLVARWSAWRSLSCVLVRAAASQRAGPRLERARHLAHGAMGCMGRPASAMRPG